MTFCFNFASLKVILHILIALIVLTYSPRDVLFPTWCIIFLGWENEEIETLTIDSKIMARSRTDIVESGIFRLFIFILLIHIYQKLYL